MGLTCVAAAGDVGHNVRDFTNLVDSLAQRGGRLIDKVGAERACWLALESKILICLAVSADL